MSRDWVELDFYTMLEVAQDAELIVIKRAYRRLAQDLHPDANPGDREAEERFKDIARAYSVLSDLSQRTLYDRMRAGADPNLIAETAGFETVDNLATASGAVLGRHIVTPVTVSLGHVVKGASVTVKVDGRADEMVDIPAGVTDGELIRLEGRGNNENGATGDLILIVQVPRHPTFGRQGDDITTRHEVSVSELSMGVTTIVATLHGPLSILIPPGTNAGTEIRIDGYGVQRSDGRSGDLIVTIMVKANERMPADATRGSFSGLIETIDKRDLDVISTIGELFDPAIHEAVGRVEPGQGRLVVTGEVRRGYMVKGQVIRPALVTVVYREEEKS